MKYIISILLFFICFNSFSQTVQKNTKDSTVFVPSTYSGAINYTVGVLKGDTTVLSNRDTSWHPLRIGTTTTYQGNAFIWTGAYWSVLGGSIQPPIIIGSTTYQFQDSTNTPPVSFPAGIDSVYYMVGAVPTGAWAGQAYKIALYVNEVLQSPFITPTVNDWGFVLTGAAQNTWHQYDGSTWPRRNAPSWSTVGNVGGGFLGSTNNTNVFIGRNNANRIVLQNSSANSSGIRFPNLNGTGNGLFGLNTNGLARRIYVGSGLTYTTGGAGVDTLTSSGSGGSQTWEETLQEQGATIFTTSNTPDIGDQSLTIHSNYGSLELGGEAGARVSLANDTSNAYAGITPASEEDGGVGSILYAANQDSSHLIRVYPNVIRMVGTPTNTHIQIPFLDSSAADADNVLWVDENNEVHRGSVSAGGGTTTNALTMNNSGSGDASGTTFNGSAARTISYNTIGAVPTTRTVNGKALSGDITLDLASADFANQGTTTTVLHGNAAGNPSFGQIVNADITNSTIDLTTKVTGVLPSANGGTGFSTYTKGDIIYASATNTLSKLGIGTANKALTVSSSGIPQWGSYIDQDSVLVTRTGLGAFGTTSTNMRSSIGFRAQNTTASTATVVQYSPVFQLEGQGWNSTDAVSVPSTFSFFVAPTIAATGASSGYANGILTIRATGPSGNTTAPFQITNLGALTTAAAIVASTGNITSSGGGLIGQFGQISNAFGVGQMIAGAVSSSLTTYRTTNGGSNITPGFFSYTSGSAGSDFIAFDGTNGFVFGQYNTAGPTVKIANARIYLTDDVNTAGSESGGIGFATQTSGAVTTEKMVLSAAGNLSLNNGNLTLATAGNKIVITEGTDGRVGSTTLVSGTKAITINGLTTNSRAFVQITAQGGTSTGVYQYKAVCTSNTLTITAIDVTGATVTTDTSVLNYFVLN